MATRKADLPPEGDDFRKGENIVGNWLTRAGWLIETEAVRDENGRKVGSRHFASRGPHQRIPVGRAWWLQMVELGAPEEMTPWAYEPEERELSERELEQRELWERDRMNR